MKSVNGFILYSKNMAKALKLYADNWMVMEGSICTSDMIKNNKNIIAGNKISIMYSGKIDKRYGIMELLEAIEQIDNDEYEFWFTGTGNAVKEVTERAKVDCRIKYLGFLPSREDLLQKQQEASMLINMRLPTERGSAYCFPSKILEYMASGRPVLSFKIGGIPDEYFNYLVEINSTNKEDIAKAIKIVANMSYEERNQFGKNARDFVINNKNSSIQAKKILGFIK